jgi:hypothetical protein
MKTFILPAFLALQMAAYGQFQNVLISTLNDPEEVTIAINPKNTSQIVAGSNINNMYYSSNGGASWVSNTITCNAYNVWGDPVVIWDTAQACYYFHLSNPTPSITPGGTWIDRIVCQQSTDFGHNYTTCTATGKNGSKGQDKQWVVVNPLNNEIHVTWTQFDNYGSSAPADSSIILYSKSTNSGASWSTPKRISFYAGDCIDSDNTVEGAVPAVGPNGELYVGWAGKKGLLFQKSLDGGNTWLAQEKVITSIPGGWDYNVNGLFRCNGLPFTFCDLSNGPNKGTIYINWSDQRNGVNDGDVWLVKSTDGGNTWTNPFRVNNDVPGKQQFMSAMTVDQATGFIYIVFYDRRNFASGSGTDVYLATSTNGGNSFTNYKVNASSFFPTTNVFFGDYIGISAHNNIVRPIWTQMTNQQLSVYTALIDPLSVGVYESMLPVLTLEKINPNPFKTETEISFSLKKELALDIQLVNNEGKVIRNISSRQTYTQGEHTIKLNAQELNLTQGIYYLVFYGDDKSRFYKLVLE